MKMEFIFNKEKLKQNGYNEEQCLNFIRNYFNKYNSKTIKEIKPGFYIGSDNDWEAFASTAFLPYTNWFLKVIAEWYWYIDEGDGLGEQKSDFLREYYEVKKINN